MKKYLLGIFALVMAIGFSAFTVNSSNTSNQNEPVYRWHQYNSAGTAELSPVVELIGTATEARDAFDCPEGTSVNCARAYEMDQTRTDFFIKKP